LMMRLSFWSFITLLACPCGASTQAEPMPVRQVQGTFRGFLEMRSEDGRLIASGDSYQYVHGAQLISRTLFTFKDGSIDDETTVFTQHRTFQLITDHHIQKGPSFPHPIDVLVDARSGEVTVRSTGKDGKEEVKTERLDMPANLANGMVPLALENLLANSTGTELSMIVASPKPRLVKLDVSSRGEEPFTVSGVSGKATHYEIKVELGGVAGVVAPLIGKAPPNIQLWIIGGKAPTFAREVGPMYPEGPMITIRLASPVWPDPSKSGD
jgi:hypothetical protein